MADRTESIVLDFEVDLEDSIESIDNLTKANKRLREERKTLNLATAEGKKRVVEINTALDNNSQVIKENLSALEKQRVNVGNYRSALDGVHPALGKVGAGLESGASGFKAMTLQALRFIASPIGATLAALVVIFGLLKTALSQNNEVLDKFENITNAVGVVVQVIIARIGKLGEALIALASGNFSEAIDLTGQAFGGLADEIGSAVTQGQLFLDLSRELEDAQRSLRVEQAKQENEIKRLVVAAKNRNLTFDEQEALLRRALVLEEQLVAKRQENAQKDLVITARRLRANKEFQQQENENFEQYIDRLVTGGKLSDDEVDKLIDKIEAVEQARGSSLAFQEKVENSLAAVQEKRAAALEKQNEALFKQSELEREQRIARLQNELKPDADNNPFDTEAKLSKNLGKNIQKDLDERQKAYDDFYKTKNAKAAQSAKYEEELEARKFQIISDLSGSLAGLMREDSIAQRGITSAMALVNTYAAAVAAYKSGAEINVFFGIAAAAAAVAAGLANVAKINGVEFAEGGWTGPGHKHQAVGVVHADEYVTPKWLVHSKQAQPHLAALEGMRRRGYQDGGLVSNSITQPINSQMDIMNFVKHMPRPIVEVVEIRKGLKSVAVKEKLSKR